MSLTCLMLFFLTRYKTVLKTIPSLSTSSELPERLSAGIASYLAQRKLFPIPITHCLTMISIDKATCGNIDHCLE